MTRTSTDEEPPRDPTMLRTQKLSSGQSMVRDPVMKESGDNESNRMVAPPAPEAATEETVKRAITGNDSAGAGAGDAEASEKVKRELNPKFKDLRETGKWGEVSKKEKYLVVAVALIVIVAVAVGVTMALRNDSNDELVRATRAPTMAPTTLSIENELVLTMNAIESFELTSMYQQDLPQSAAAYATLQDDPDATPQQRAMAWLLHEDGRDMAAEVRTRWALASLYYSWGGEKWNSAENWLSSDSACDWEHISCDSLTGAIQEVNLESNNLVGTIPPEIAMLNTTQSLWLRDNQLSGTLPNEVFGAMPRLSILYLNNNRLSGTISLSIRDNEVLSSLFLQSNNLTGEWPRRFCPSSATEGANVRNFGIDCDEVNCDQAGCCTGYNCYYDD